MRWRTLRQKTPFHPTPARPTDMKTRRIHPLSFVLGLTLAFGAGAAFGGRTADPAPSAVTTRDAAVREDFEWGTLYTYFQGESYGTQDGLAAVAVINPGMEIHPPHEHTEEEYMLVTSGRGTWHLKGEAFEAQTGDMLYAAPWDIHGITNTGDEPLTFVVWKWNNKGVAVPEQPAQHGE